jgi:hypothetical protein
MLPEKNFRGGIPNNLHMENELKKIKLILEHGADIFYPNDQHDLPPEIENEFLKTIEEFENAYRDCKKITVYDFIGKPEFKKSEVIPEREIAKELELILGILQENQIELTSICELEEREKYRFIVEELFQHEIEDMRMKGMMCCFIYEEFHPNHEFDIKDHAADFITSFLNKESDYYTCFISGGGNFVKDLNNFRDSYESFFLEHFSINSVNHRDGQAVVNYRIEFKGIIEGTVEKQLFKGEGIMDLIYQDSFWIITKVKFPDAPLI